MKIALASKSELKLQACRRAFSHVADAEFVAVAVNSSVNEQPLNGETIQGAFNRICALRGKVQDANVFVSIENGLFQEGGKYIDRPVVMIENERGQGLTMWGEGVAFPTECVLEAQSRGFDKWTVGKVMQEAGIIKQHDDPHMDLSGRSRAAYIDDVMSRVVKTLRL